MTQSGYLVLFDLSGYTAFLAQSSVHQAPGILESLIGTVIAHVEPPLVVAEVEGDAIFAYAPDHGFAEGRAFLDAIERIYCVFAAAREQMERHTACDCAGCRLFPQLDLKIVAHRGEYALRRMLPQAPAKPVGADVVVAHRLLKNAITERTGIRAYAFLSDACVGAMSATPVAHDAIRHVETVEHIGEVAGYVHDLGSVWAAERMKRLVRVEATDAWIEASAAVAAPVAAVWAAIDSPAFRRLWRFAEPERSPEGPRRLKTIQPCYDGETVSVERVVDWKPPEQLTLECVWPDGPCFLVTVELAAAGAGTQLAVRVARPIAAAAPPAAARPFHADDARWVEARCRENLEMVRRWLAGGGADPPALPDETSSSV